MPKMPRLGGSHTLAQLEELAHKIEADAQPKESAPDLADPPPVHRPKRVLPK